jgi:hypothetical protein
MVPISRHPKDVYVKCEVANSALVSFGFLTSKGSLTSSELCSSKITGDIPRIIGKVVSEDALESRGVHCLPLSMVATAALEAEQRELHVISPSFTSLSADHYSSSGRVVTIVDRSAHASRVWQNPYREWSDLADVVSI